MCRCGYPSPLQDESIVANEREVVIVQMRNKFVEMLHVFQFIRRRTESIFLGCLRGLFITASFPNCPLRGLELNSTFQNIQNSIGGFFNVNFGLLSTSLTHFSFHPPWMEDDEFHSGVVCRWCTRTPTAPLIHE